MKKKILKNFVIIICLFTFISCTLIPPKKTEAFAPVIVAGGVTVAVLLATATVCVALGIKVKCPEQLEGIAEKLNSLTDFKTYLTNPAVLTSSCLSVKSYWRDYLNTMLGDTCATDKSIDYNFAPSTATDNTLMSDVFSSAKACGLPYIIIKQSLVSSYYKYDFYKVITAPGATLTKNYLSFTYTLPSFANGNLLKYQQYQICYNVNNTVNSHFGCCGDIPNFLIRGDYNSLGENLVSVGYNGFIRNDYVGVWDYGNCTLPEGTRVGDYGSTGGIALPSDNTKDWDSTFGVDGEGVIDVSGALERLKAQGIDISKPVSADVAKSCDITYPIENVADIPGVAVDDTPATPFTPSWDTPADSEAPSLDFKPLMIVSKKFPFSLPWDLKNAIVSLKADSVAPVFNFNEISIDLRGEHLLTIPSFSFDINTVPNIVTLASILKFFELLGFCVFLIAKTRDIIRS